VVEGQLEVPLGVAAEVVLALRAGVGEQPTDDAGQPERDQQPPLAASVVIGGGTEDEQPDADQDAGGDVEPLEDVGVPHAGRLEVAEHPVRTRHQAGEGRAHPPVVGDHAEQAQEPGEAQRGDGRGGHDRIVPQIGCTPQLNCRSGRESWVTSPVSADSVPPSPPW